jgi:hypothetical protein
MQLHPAKQRRFRPELASLRDHLLAEIEALAIELREAADATARGNVPIAARAEYLRAQDAHRRAVIAWTSARGRDEHRAIAETLRQCRNALESARALLRR